MAKPVLFIVGADKGGVGKTMMSRALIDYLAAGGFEHRAFDTETPVGMLRRFHPARTEIVDLTDSDGQMRVFDTLGTAATVIDIRAGLLSPTLETLSDIGFLNPSKYDINVLHVLGNTMTSIDEVAALTQRLAGIRHVLIGNRINATKFSFPTGALDIPMLNAKACEEVDAASVSFSDFIKSDASPVLRGYVESWLGKVHNQFRAAKLP